MGGLGYGRSRLQVSRLWGSRLRESRLWDSRLCPITGPNNELHLAFNCTAMDSLRQEPWMKEVLHEAIGKENFNADDPTKLGHFLGGDSCSEETLHNRGKYLNILLQKHLESR